MLTSGTPTQGKQWRNYPENSGEIATYYLIKLNGKLQFEQRLNKIWMM